MVWRSTLSKVRVSKTGEQRGIQRLLVATDLLFFFSG
jgi:hypothetical protein